MEKRQKYIISGLGLLMIVITLFTHFYGNTDIYDYSDSAKFFTGQYDAKIRTSHSYLYGLVHSPFVGMMENYFSFKITSLIVLFLLIYSVYRMSGKDKRALWLIMLSPIIWYMSPWISPIQLASLLFLWGYHFTKEYDGKGRLISLFYAGALIGLSWAFWDGVLFFIPLFLISFFYNKSLIHSIYFSFFILIGVLPRLILDKLLFGFAFFGIFRHVIASSTLTIYGGFYNQGRLYGIFWLILLLIFIPFYTYLVFKPRVFTKNKKTSIFILLSLLLLIINSQVRFLLIVAPIIILTIYKEMTKKQFLIQCIIFSVITLLVINPYIIQAKYEINGGENLGGHELGSFIKYFSEMSTNNEFKKDLISSDLNEISSKHPGETFVVGNRLDSYQILADIYWGNNVKEFVSIQDYNLYLNNETTIAEKEFCSHVLIGERRDICASMYIRKAFNDETDYKSIIYAISEGKTLDIEGFTLVEEYRTLSLFEKNKSI